MLEAFQREEEYRQQWDGRFQGHGYQRVHRYAEGNTILCIK